MSAVHFEGITLRLGSRAVLENISFDVGPGEFIGVLGPNGAGKTTLMRAILGLVRPANGRIVRAPGAVGYLPQTRVATAAARLRARDLLASSLRGACWGVPRADAADRADIARVLALVDARGLADRPLGRLSGGERQRILLAQSVLGRPTLLLLDEPLAGLDPRRQQETVALIRQLQRELGLTVLLSAHDLNPLLGAIDRVLYLANTHAVIGKVADVVTSEVLSGLYETPIEVIRVGGKVLVAA